MYVCPLCPGKEGVPIQTRDPLQGSKARCGHDLAVHVAREFGSQGIHVAFCTLSLALAQDLEKPMRLIPLALDLRAVPQRGGPMIDTYATAITQYVEAGGTRYAYRRMGMEAGVPLIFMQNFRQGMDNIDPWLLDGFARDRPVIIFDNTGVASSSGETPDTVEAMADHVAAFVGALELSHVDVLAFPSAAIRRSPLRCAIHSWCAD
jgi:hypothetical protein